MVYLRKRVNNIKYIARKEKYLAHMAKELRVGVFGGTFNPPHCSHVELARLVKERFSLDEIIIIPSSIPPHKTIAPGASGIERLTMARLAFTGDGMTLSDVELNRPGTSYTVDTLRELAASQKNASLYLIIGGDMLRDFENWHDIAGIFSLASIIAVERESERGGGHEIANRLKEKYGAKTEFINLNLAPISSTAVREAVYEAKPVTGDIPHAVERYIYENSLYMPKQFRAMQQKIRGMLQEKRYAHTVGVMICAVELASYYNVDGAKARLAALLHDCGRAVDRGALSHAQMSEKIARERFGINDEIVLQAIRVHTTLCEAPSELDKIIYVADMVEQGREYEGVASLRKIAKTDLNKAAIECLNETIRHVISKGKTVKEDSMLALDYMRKSQRTKHSEL